MHPDIESVLYSEETLHNRVKELGEAITRDYAGQEVLFVGVLKGSFIFMSDLVRCVDLKCAMDFMAVSSYGNSTVSSGVVEIKKDLSADISGRNVILVEDILDTGNTLYYLRQYLMNRGPASIRIATLMDKPARRTAAIRADYAGFDIPDAFVVGYGLDYAENYRNLPYVGILKPEVYSK